VGEGGSAGNAPGASAAAFTFVGVGGSTSMLCVSCEVVVSCGCAIAVSGAVVCCGTSSFFVSSPEGRGELALAPCIPRPVASVSCPGGLFSFSFSLAGTRGVSTASSKAS
jgi:hypothetical protein